MQTENTNQSIENGNRNAEAETPAAIASGTGPEDSAPKDASVSKPIDAAGKPIDRDERKTPVEKRKPQDPALSVLTRRQELGNDPFRGILKWEFLEGLEAAGKKVKADVLLKLFVREIARDVPDRFLVGKIAARIHASPKEFKAKNFWAELSAAEVSPASVFGKLDATCPAPLHAEFRQFLSKTWKTDRKAASEKWTEAEIAAAETWIRDGRSSVDWDLAVYTGANRLVEESENRAKLLKDEIDSARKAATEAKDAAAALRRTMQETAESKLAQFPAKLDNLIAMMDDKRRELIQAQSLVEMLRTRADDSVSALREQIDHFKSVAETERRLRNEAEGKIKSLDSQLQQAGWDKDAAISSKQGLKKDIAAALSVFYDDFRGMDADLDPGVAAPILKSHLENVFRILQRKEIPIGKWDAQ